jgi:hypothetical protein
MRTDNHPALTSTSSRFTPSPSDAHSPCTRRQAPDFLADNGATDTIVNGDYLHLVQNFEDITGDIIGANRVKVGAVFGTGFINFFGERIKVYAANTRT